GWWWDGCGEVPHGGWWWDGRGEVPRGGWWWDGRGEVPRGGWWWDGRGEPRWGGGHSPPPPPPPGAIRSFGSAKARYDFCARDRTELTLREGDVIRVLSKKGHPGWWKGEIYGRV
ncbi:VAV protein, partial [Chauna torquata]|nr:VAV protein [Chauna torquata]